MLVLLVCIFVVLSLTQENFFTRPNIENLLTSVSILFVVSMGMTFVVLTAGIDLSVGSTLALMGILLSHLFNNVGLPAWLAVLLTLIAGALLGGLVNGVLIGKVGLSFFVVTLGTLSLYQGIVNIWSGTETTYITSSFIDWFGFGTVLGIPSPIWIMLATYLVAFVVLRWTYFGRDVYAVGGNIEAARLSGINVSRTLIFVYGISGLAAALGGRDPGRPSGRRQPDRRAVDPARRGGGGAPRRNQLPRGRRRRHRHGGRGALHRHAAERALDLGRVELLAAGGHRRDPDRRRRDRPSPAEPGRPLPAGQGRHGSWADVVGGADGRSRVTVP